MSKYDTNRPRVFRIKPYMLAPSRVREETWYDRLKKGPRDNLPMVSKGKVDWDNVGPLEWSMLVGDSFFHPRRIGYELFIPYGRAGEFGPGIPDPEYAPRYHVERVVMEPHEVHQTEIPCNAPVRCNFSPVVNCHIRYLGGMLFDQLLFDSETVQAWATKMPLVVLFHIGGCDISRNPVARIPTQPQEDGELETSSGRRFFLNNICAVVDYFRRLGVGYARTEKQRNYVRNCVFLFSTLPDWGPDFTPQRPTDLKPEEFKALRRRNNNYAKRNMSFLWNTHKVLLLDLNLGNFPEREGVHLAAGEAQTAYARKIRKVMARHLCRWCRMDTHLDGRTMSLPQVKDLAHAYVHGPSCEDVHPGAVNNQDQ